MSKIKTAATLIFLAQSQLPPTYITRDSNGDLVVTQPGTDQPPIYVEPLPNTGDYLPKFQIVQPGSNEPPSYAVPDSDGGVEIIQPNKR
jgi:hypothetical protein